jgi:hypothetical protein
VFVLPFRRELHARVHKIDDGVTAVQRYNVDFVNLANRVRSLASGLRSH